MTEQALAGLNIVVTRPREQATNLAQRITQAGGRAILFPLLEIKPVTDPQPLRALVSQLAHFNLAIFISPNAVHYGMQAILEKGPLLTTLKIATVGQGSAKLLRELGVSEVIAPQDKFDSEALLALPALQQVAGWRVAIFRGDGGRELLGDTLKARGAMVEYAACYHRTKPQHNLIDLLAANPHAITVTSSEALVYLSEMVAEMVAEKVGKIEGEGGHNSVMTLPLFVPHDRIAHAAHQLNWRNVSMTAAGDEGLIAGLMSWAKTR